LCIKEATGVSRIQEVFTRFRFQRETQKHLKELKKITQIRRMQEDTLKLQQEFEEINKDDCIIIQS